MTSTSALDVAVQLRKRLPGVGTKKIHKLLYYCQGHHLATFGEPLFHDRISAWNMGPVVGTLWNYEHQNGEATGPARSLDEAQLNTVGYVLSRYGALSGLDLEHLTHSETPWQEANDGRAPNKSAKIPVESIKAYFVDAAADEDDTPPLDMDAVATFLSGAEKRLKRPVTRDTPEAIRAKLATRSA